MLVTGGAGFIGSHIVDELIAMGHEVVVLDDLSGGFKENINDSAVFIKGSVQDDILIKNLFKKYNFNYVYHFAAYAAEGLSHFIKKFNYENNLIGSINLINASVNYNVKCFVFTSSIAVYGTAQLPMRENTIPIPEDSYGIAKLAVEQELRICKEMFGLNYVIFRPHNVYGERQNIGDKYRNVIGIFINQIMQGKPLTVFGKGEQTRAFTYIKDIAPIIARSVFLKKAYNQIFNVGADKPYSINELAEVVCASMKAPIKIRYLESRNEVFHAFADHRKVRKVFAVKPKYTLEEGIKRMVEWAKIIGSKKSKIFSHIEISKNMPESWQKIVK